MLGNRTDFGQGGCVRRTRARSVTAAFSLLTLTFGCSADTDVGGPTSASAVERKTTTSTTTMPSPTSTTTTVPPMSTLAIELDHYAIHPADTTVVAGRVALDVRNLDTAPHDVTLVATSVTASELPTSGIVIDEDDPRIDVLARTPRLGAGSEGVIDVELDSGTYVLVCSVPHHYVRNGMAAVLEVVAA